MPHAKSLRAIGQSLESIGGLVAFTMERNGRNYVVRSDSLPEIAELSHKQSLSEKVWDSTVSARQGAHLIRDNGTLQYDPAYVSWLDAQGRKKRRKRFSAQATGTMKFSQLLRTVGRHIDRLEPHSFTVSWTKDSVSIDYDMDGSQKLTEIIPFDKLRELTVRMRVRRARRR